MAPDMAPDLSAPLRDWLPTIWYAGFLPGLPDLCVGRWPAVFQRPVPWKIWIVRTPAERAALAATLTAPVPVRNGALNFSAGPDAAVRARTADEDYVALYVPPEQGWPWITLMSLTMSSDDAARLGAARGRYTWDADLTEEAAIDRIVRLRQIVPAMPVRTPDLSSRH